MMVVTIVVNGEVVDEIQIENKMPGSHYQPGFYEWRSTKRVASGEVRHDTADGPHRLAAKVLQRRAWRVR